MRKLNLCQTMMVKCKHARVFGENFICPCVLLSFQLFELVTEYISQLNETPVKIHQPPVSVRTLITYCAWYRYKFSWSKYRLF
jgi:hypothetical protein